MVDDPHQTPKGSAAPFTPVTSSGIPSPSSSRLDLDLIDAATASIAPELPAMSPPTERTPLLSTPSVTTDHYAGDESETGTETTSRIPVDRSHLMVAPYRGTSVDDDGDSAIRPLNKKPSKTIRVAKKIRRRGKYYVPISAWLPKYNWSLFSGDLVAGVSVACLLVPQAMSYASGLAGLTPVAGLWATAIPALVYSVFGTSRQMSMGPEASLSLLMGHTINELVHSDPHSPPDEPELEAIAVAVATTLQVGAITTLLGLLRLGFLDVVLSRALLRGFLTAIGFIIMVEQLVPLLGLAPVLRLEPNPPHLPIPKLIFILTKVHFLNVPTAILGTSSITFLLASKFLKDWVTKRPGGVWLRYVPQILILVIGVDILGKIKGGSEIPFGLPLYPRTLKYLSATFPTAFVMAVVGIVDSMVAAKENATKFGYQISPNRELVAYGVSNLVASCVTVTGTLPVFGSLTRSRLNGQNGARTQMASMVCAVLMILSIFFLLPYLFFLPRAVLASIITLVVYGLLDEAPHDILYFWKMRAWTDLLQMTGTFLLTIFFSIEIGVVASICFSLLLVIQRSTKPRIKILGRLPGSNEWVPIDEDDEAQEEIPGVLVIRIREALSFANTGQLKERLRRLELYGPKKAHPSDRPTREDAKAIILHMGDVEDIDASALQIIDELVRSYRERGVGIYFAHLRPDSLDKLRIVGIPELLGLQHFHPDLRSAMRQIESLGYSGATGSSRYA